MKVTLSYRLENEDVPRWQMMMEGEVVATPPLPNIGDHVRFETTLGDKAPLTARVMDRTYTYAAPDGNSAGDTLDMRIEILLTR